MWDDSSGNGNLATPINAAAPPLSASLNCPYITSTSPCVAFSAASSYDGLQIASTSPSSLDLTGGFSILAVAMAETGAATPAVGGIYTRQATSAGFPGATLWMPYQDTGHYTASQGYPATQIDDLGDFAIWQANLVDNTFHLYAAVYDGANSLSIRVGMSGAAVTVTVPTTTISATGRPAFVGGQTGQTLNGRLAEVLVISGPISNANYASAYAYYHALYGILP